MTMFRYPIVPLLIILLSWAFPGHSQTISIPDPGFLQALIEVGVDTNGDNNISMKEAEHITSLDIAGKRDEDKRGVIRNLDGIEAFINLCTLRCNNNQISSLDLSSNTSLTFLRCNNNRLTRLDLSACRALAVLVCDNNQISNLDLTNNTLLRSITCWENRLSSLDVSACQALTRLDSDFNRLRSLDFSANPNLIYLNCRMNQLSSLNISGCISLTELACEGNLLTELNLSGNTALKKLICSKNRLNKLDVSGNTFLAKIDLRNNPDLKEVCVWIIPFPPEGTNISIEGSPGVSFTSDCTTSARF